MNTHKRTKSGLQPGAGEGGINPSNEKPAKQEESKVIDELFAIMDGVEGSRREIQGQVSTFHRLVIELASTLRPREI